MGDLARLQVAVLVNQIWGGQALVRRGHGISSAELSAVGPSETAQALAGAPAVRRLDSTDLCTAHFAARRAKITNPRLLTGLRDAEHLEQIEKTRRVVRPGLQALSGALLPIPSSRSRCPTPGLGVGEGPWGASATTLPITLHGPRHSLAAVSLGPAGPPSPPLEAGEESCSDSHLVSDFGTSSPLEAPCSRS